ncbi:hypothetical protein FVE85_8484 [Porphyridium purpureum]|uniref:Seipin n=1 Tax=Porphyridium purpureum TaxID=35688 RepID=A0A5J4YLW3_PORPP|nr:hypothetical protein FVE85_8484 [Porphyridium purpureum]|eukprot:POR4775..scf244_11
MAVVPSYPSQPTHARTRSLSSAVTCWSVLSLETAVSGTRRHWEWRQRGTMAFDWYKYIRMGLVGLYLWFLFCTSLAVISLLAQLLIWTLIPSNIRVPVQFMSSSAAVHGHATHVQALRARHLGFEDGRLEAVVELPHARSWWTCMDAELELELAETMENLEHSAFTVHATAGVRVANSLSYDEDAFSTACAWSLDTSATMLYKSRASITIQAIVYALPLLLGLRSEYQRVYVPFTDSCCLRPIDMLVCLEQNQKNTSTFIPCRCDQWPEPSVDAISSETGASGWQAATHMKISISPTVVAPARAWLRMTGTRPWLWSSSPLGTARKIAFGAVIILWYVSALSSLILAWCVGFSIKSVLETLFKKGTGHRATSELQANSNQHAPRDQRTTQSSNPRTRTDAEDVMSLLSGTSEAHQRTEPRPTPEGDRDRGHLTDESITFSGGLRRRKSRSRSRAVSETTHSAE